MAAQIKSDNTNLTLNADGSNDIKFQSNGVEKASIDQDGNVVASGTISSTGDTTITNGDIVFATAGKGICLGVTSNTDANTLDDYEEGTWTVGIGSGTIGAGDGVYTKIGNKVTAWFQANTFSNRTNTASLRIMGLPFTSSGTMGNHSCGSIMCSYTDNPADTAYITHNVTYIDFYGNGTGAWDYLKYNDLNNASASLYGFVTYYVD